jgi:hypothetical protein
MMMKMKMSIVSLPTEVLLVITKCLDVRDRVRFLCALPKQEARLVRGGLDANHERAMKALYRYAVAYADKGQSQNEKKNQNRNHKLKKYLSTHDWDVTTWFVAEKLDLMMDLQKEVDAQKLQKLKLQLRDTDVFFELLQSSTIFNSTIRTTPAAAATAAAKVLEIGRRIALEKKHERESDRLYDAILCTVPRLLPHIFDALLDSGIIHEVLRDDQLKRDDIREMMLLWCAAHYGNVSLFEHILSTCDSIRYPWSLTDQLDYVFSYLDDISSNDGAIAALKVLLARPPSEKQQELVRKYLRTFAEELRWAPLECLLQLVAS